MINSICKSQISDMACSLAWSFAWPPHPSHAPNPRVGPALNPPSTLSYFPTKVN